MTDQDALADATEIGVVVVHGIGEQKRFEHLDAHVRGLINALRRRPATDVTVEIVGSGVAAMHATQASWRTGPGGSIRIVVRDATGLTRLHVHEVWWADVNEPYSLMKQVRFWLWGLAVWNYPAHTAGARPTGQSMFPPRPGADASPRLIGRAQLFLVSCFFLLASGTVGVATVLAKRLFNFEAPDLVQIFANYLSSVKLYTQRHRATGDFLDTIGEPPRISVRRRMLRTLADVASQPYARWYVLAHSQGSVVAFNGLMEPAFGWPGYFDEDRWADLVGHGFAGPAAPGFTAPSLDGMVPAWPAWARRGDPAIAYRRRIFARFRGLLTYGAPIEKFAAIWPARVPVCREPAFGDARWINVYDPMDPVSGIMRSWPTKASQEVPPPENFGYAADPLLLLGHTRYLDCPPAPPVRPDDVTLADATAEWLLTDRADLFGRGAYFFGVGRATERFRRLGALAQGTTAFVAAALAAGLAAAWALGHRLEPWRHAAGALAVAAVLTLVAGLLFRLGADPDLDQSAQPDEPFTPVPIPPDPVA